MAWYDFLKAGNDRITTSGGLRSNTRGMLARLRGVLPAEWFPDDSPTLDGLLAGLARGLVFGRGLISYAKAQTRIRTAFGFWLDLIAWDFFGPRFRRRQGESDDSFRPRILKELLRPRATRGAMVQALTDLTGKAPELYEPWHPGDCGAYDVGTLAYSGDAGVAPRLAGYDAALGGYDVGGLAFLDPNPDAGASAGAGCWGSYELPNQVFVRVHRGSSVFRDVEGCGAYDTPGFAYDGGPGQPGHGFLGGESVEGSITDDEIYATVAATVAAGVTAWTQILPK